MLRRLYDRVLALAASPRAPWWLAVVSFCESSFFPIPPDVLLAPMAVARPERAWRFAAICTVASVGGGVLGYFIGYALFEPVVRPILILFGSDPDKFMARYYEWYGEFGLWFILAKGVLPIPYKIVTIASGAAKFDFWVFIGASIVTRGARFFLVAGVMNYFSDRFTSLLRDYPGTVTALVAGGVIFGFVILKLI